MAKIEAKTEERAAPDIITVNRILRGEPTSASIARTVDLEAVVDLLRRKNSRLQEAAQASAEKEARDQAANKKQYESAGQEVFRRMSSSFSRRRKSTGCSSSFSLCARPSTTAEKYKTMSLNLSLQIERSGPKPAGGQHLELLGEMKLAIDLLGRYIEAEQSGVYDGLGQNNWVDSDPVTATARRILALAESRGSIAADAQARR